MNLPIKITENIESDSIWSIYKSERDAAKSSIEAMKGFVKRWEGIYPFKSNQININEEMLEVIKSEKPGEQDTIATNIILPISIFYAMVKAKEFNVPLNVAFIQANGGFGNFY